MNKTEPEPTPETTGEQPTQADNLPGVDPEILAIQKEAGVNILDSDPEVDMIDRSKGMHQFYKSIEAAAKAKKERLGGQPQTPSNPASRLPVKGTAPKGLPDDMPAHKMWQHVKYEYKK